MANSDHNKRQPYYGGFTLIELSIVLVVIGLLIGGVLVGRDLIAAASIRSQISQIENYNIAANTFKLKYMYLPGDIPEPHASGFGFIPRGAYVGQGDGNGRIQLNNVTITSGEAKNRDEQIVFWRDLSTAKLIAGDFSVATFSNQASGALGSAEMARFIPRAKIWDQASIGIFNDGYAVNYLLPDGFNYLLLARQWSIGDIAQATSLTVAQAYSIDKKIDDGLPQYGTVQSWQFNASQASCWASGGEIDENEGQITDAASGTNCAPITAADGLQVPPNDLTCYDNRNVVGAIAQYSTQWLGGSGLNCSLAFKFK